VDSAFAVPREVGDPAATARAVARIVGLDRAETRKLAGWLEADREFVWVARKLDPPQAEALRALRLPGIHFLQESKRYYPLRRLAAQVLGYVGTDNHGLGGPDGGRCCATRGAARSSIPTCRSPTRSPAPTST
jgi:cell division protein FtsI/penicillin-binding protein 2